MTQIPATQSSRPPDAPSASPEGNTPEQRGFFGHPRGLATLFFTEMWERFSYYGMRALLILFMTRRVAAGGLGFDTATGGRHLRHLHGDGVPGAPAGRLDRGPAASASAARCSYGGILIAAGPLQHGAAGDARRSTSGLMLIVLGTGLLKPNISAMVGQLYPEGDARRDAGFSIFYMGINIGAFIAPLVVRLPRASG